MVDYFTNVRRDVIDLIPRESYQSSLEIGGGDFATILALRELCGTTAWGVDIRETHAQLDHFLHGSITDPQIRTKLPDAGFDLIIANDVIEHIVDTSEFMSVCKSKLSQKGLLILSVPNARQIRFMYHVAVRGTFPREDSGLFDKTHLRWFCKSDVISILKTSGFEVVDAKSVGRFVPDPMSRSHFAEFLALQNIFVARAS